MTDFLFRENTTDEFTFNKCLTENEYRLPESFSKDDVVIDIGAHVGGFTTACLQRGVGLVIALEANPDTFKYLVHNTFDYSDRVICINMAVWRSDIIEPNLTYTADYWYNGIENGITENRTGIGNVIYGGTTKVMAIGLDTILAQFDKIRMIKLDVEGAEFPILFTSKLLHKADEIVGEFHEMCGEYDGYASIPEIARVRQYEKYTADKLGPYLSKSQFVVNVERNSYKLNGGHFYSIKRKIE